MNHDSRLPCTSHAPNRCTSSRMFMDSSSSTTASHTSKSKRKLIGKRREKPIRPNKSTQETGLGRKISKTHRENEATGTEDRTVWHALRIDLRSAISICRVASASLLRNRTKYKQKGRGKCLQRTLTPTLDNSFKKNKLERRKFCSIKLELP